MDSFVSLSSATLRAHTASPPLARPAAAEPRVSLCPADALLRLLSGPWTTALLWTLQRHGPQRFGQLRRAIPGISARLLTVRLQRLQSAGLVGRQSCPSEPREQRYGLTSRGEALGRLFAEMDTLAQRWAEEDASARV